MLKNFSIFVFALLFTANAMAAEGDFTISFSITNGAELNKTVDGEHYIQRGRSVSVFRVDDTRPYCFIQSENNLPAIGPITGSALVIFSQPNNKFYLAKIIPQAEEALGAPQTILCWSAVAFDVKALEKTLAGVVSISTGPINTEETVLAQTNFLVRNGRKEFNVQRFPSRNMYVFNFGLLWANFNPQMHSNGYDLAVFDNIQFTAPALPRGCVLASAAASSRLFGGMLNGVNAGSNVLQFTLTGNSCEQYAEALQKEKLVLSFENVAAQQSGAPVTPNLRLEVLDLP